MLRKLFGAKRSNSKKRRTPKRKGDSHDELMHKNDKNNKTISLLLLGPGGSGKSTILKQIQKIYNGSISDEILKDITLYIKQNMLEDIYVLSHQNTILINIHSQYDAYLSSLISNGYLRLTVIDLNIFIPEEIVHIICKYHYYSPLQLSEGAQIICNKIASLKGEHWKEVELTSDLAKQISILWNDKGLQETFNIHKRKDIMDNAPYFFEHIQKISQTQYIADFEDYIRLRHRTCGIIKYEFSIDIDKTVHNEWIMKITDFGGSRAVRKRVVRCFNDIHALIYVMPLDGYDKVLFEDHSQNCYREAFEVFVRTIELKALDDDVEIIVLLNKYDLFVEKIKQVPFTVFEPNFDEYLGNNANAVIGHIRDEFQRMFDKRSKQQTSDKTQRKLQFHVVSSLDNKQMESVIQSIQCQIINKISSSFI